MSTGRSVRRTAVSICVTLLVVAAAVTVLTSAVATGATIDGTSVQQLGNDTATNGTATETPTGDGTDVDEGDDATDAANGTATDDTPTDDTATNDTANGTATNETAEPAPEFVLSVTPETDSVVVGDPFVVTVTVRNVGNESGTKGVEFEAEGVIVTERNVTLAPGTDRTLRFTHRFSEAGNETVEVDHSIQRTVVVEPREANLTVENVSVSGESVEAGEPVTVSATVTNDGRANGTRQVELVMFGDVVDVQTVSVAPGESERVSFTRRIDQPGTYTASIAGQERQIQVRGDDQPSPTATTTTTPAASSAPGFGLLAAAGALATLAVALLVRRRGL